MKYNIDTNIDMTKPMVVSGSRDSSLRIIDLMTGKIVGKPFVGHTAVVSCVAVFNGFSETDNSTHTNSYFSSAFFTGTTTTPPIDTNTQMPIIVSGGEDNSLIVWSVSSQSIIFKLNGHEFDVTAVTIYFPGPKYYPYKFQECGKLTETTIQTAEINKYTASHGLSSLKPEYPMEPLIISGGMDGQLRIWGGTEGDVLAIIEDCAAHITAVATVDLPTGPLMIAGDGDGKIHLWSLTYPYQLIASIDCHSDEVASLAVYCEAKFPVLLSGSWDMTTKVWNLNNYQFVKTIEGHKAEVAAIVVFSTGSGIAVATGSSDTTVRISYDFLDSMLKEDIVRSAYNFDLAAINSHIYIGKDHHWPRTIELVESFGPEEFFALHYGLFYHSLVLGRIDFLTVFLPMTRIGLIKSNVGNPESGDGSLLYQAIIMRESIAVHVIVKCWSVVLSTIPPRGDADIIYDPQSILSMDDLLLLAKCYPRDFEALILSLKLIPAQFNTLPPQTEYLFEADGHNELRIFAGVIKIGGENKDVSDPTSIKISSKELTIETGSSANAMSPTKNAKRFDFILANQSIDDDDLPIKKKKKTHFDQTISKIAKKIHNDRSSQTNNYSQRGLRSEVSVNSTMSYGMKTFTNDTSSLFKRNLSNYVPINDPKSVPRKNGSVRFADEKLYYEDSPMRKQVSRSKTIKRNDNQYNQEIDTFVRQFSPSTSIASMSRANSRFQTGDDIFDYAADNIIDVVTNGILGPSVKEKVHTKSYWWLPLHNPAHIYMLRAISHVCDELDSTEIFDSDAGKLILGYAWKSFGRRSHVKAMLFYISYVAVATTSVYVFEEFLLLNDEKGRTGREILPLFLILIVLIFDVYYFVIEFNQFYHLEFREYISDVWNQIDITVIFTSVMGNITRLIQWRETNASRVFLSIASIAMWFNLLYYLRAFEVTGPLVSMILRIAKDMKAFLLVLAIVIVGFSQAFWLLSNRMEGLDFSSIDKSYVSAFSYMLGNFDPDGFDGASLESWGIFLSCIYMLIGSILLLNLLIALMGDSYSDVKAKGLAQWRLEQAQLIIEFGGSLKLKDKHCTRPLYSCRYADEVVEFASATEKKENNIVLEEVKNLKELINRQQEMITKILEKNEVSLNNTIH